MAVALSGGNDTLVAGGGNDTLVAGSGVAFKLAAASFPAAPNCQVTADTLTTTRTITVQFANPAGTTATDPASGEVVYFNVTLGDSTAS